ncbi:DMT family transporter [Paenibacillus turicensis]|uniref:DMT family transporter n=1 Tax=Paenibacillus turicensis TaxID=160487 RepID=UPI003D2E01E6
MTSRRLILGAIFCLIASISWGAMFPVAHVALAHIDPFYFSFIRYLVVGIILAVILGLKEGKKAFRLEKRGLMLTFYGSMAFTVYNMCVFMGQHMAGESGPISASIMETMMPMISIAFLWITTKKAPPFFTIISIVIATLGAFLVSTRGDLTFFSNAAQNVFPLLFIFIGVVGWVIYSMGGSRYSDWSILRYSTLTCLLGSLVSFVIISIGTAIGVLNIPTLQQLGTIKYEMSFMILLPGLAALLCWNAGLKLLSPINGILFINFVPVTTFLIMALQGYHINMYELYGTLLIIFALVFNNFAGRRSHVLQPKVIKPQQMSA